MAIGGNMLLLLNIYPWQAPEIQPQAFSEAGLSAYVPHSSDSARSLTAAFTF